MDSEVKGKGPKGKALPETEGSFVKWCNYACQPHSDTQSLAYFLACLIVFLLLAFVSLQCLPHVLSAEHTAR